MRNIENVIKSYLSKSTQYAVLIDGIWGRGKTFYYKNTLENLISKIQTPENAKKNYKPIYVSLFGMKSIEDIATKIVLDFYQLSVFNKYFKPSGDNKKLRITQGVISIALRGFLNVKKLGRLEDFIPEITKIGQTTLDNSELTICFDDLERRDSKLNIEDFAGYVNTLIDEGVKVIMIAHEDKLLPSGQTYKDLKEKIIGISLQYTPEVKTTIESIINSKYTSSLVFKTYLESNIDLLIDFSNTVDNNFRHFIFSLDALYDCYSILRDSIIDPKHEISDKLTEMLPELTKFILGISAEFRASKLKAADEIEFSNHLATMEQIFSNHIGNDIASTDTRYKKFIDDYKITKQTYFCYHSIFQFLTGNAEFDISEFIKEFSRNFSLQKGASLPQYDLLNSLLYFNYLELTDLQYKQNTNAVIKNATEGNYKTGEYLTVMFLAERLNNILNFDLDKVREKLKKGLLIAIKNTPVEYQGEFTQFEFSGRSEEISANNKLLYDYGIEEIKKERIKRTKLDATNIANIFVNSPSEFLDRYQKEPAFSVQVNNFPILCYLDIVKLWVEISKLPLTTILAFSLFIHQRYKQAECLKNEKKKLLLLSKTVKNDLKKLKGKMSLRQNLILDFSRALENYLSQNMI